MKQHFREFAAYNAWANKRIQDAADRLDEAAYRRPIGLFFDSIHGTLNHLLLTDRQWLGRLTGERPEGGPQDRILFEDRAALRDARRVEEVRLTETVERYSDSDLGADFTYQNTSGKSFTQPLRSILAHLFNHQTHHRSQLHTGLQLLTGEEPPSLDLLAYQREQMR